MSEKNESYFFFPLRTNVDFFVSPDTYLNLQSRIKQALILYDNLIFEAGVYEGYFGDKGSMDLIRPFDPKTDGEINHPDPKDKSNFFVDLKPTNSSKDAPFIRIIDSPKEREFLSQFHSIANEMINSGITNIHLRSYELPAEYLNLSNNTTTLDKKSLNTDYIPGGLFLKNAIVKNLNLDLSLMTYLKVPICVDELHAPLLTQKLIDKGKKLKIEPGFLSMEILLPNISNLSWDEIADFRNEPSLRNLRDRMRQIEIIARNLAQTPDSFSQVSGEIELLIHTLHEEGLYNEIDRLIPKGREVGQSIAFGIIGSIFPVIGISKEVADGGLGIKELRDYQHSWLAGFMKLRKIQGK